MFADDLAATLVRFLVGLPPVLHIFALLSAMAGLSVNNAKTLVINYSDQWNFHFKRMLVEATGAAQISVARVGIYLGALIGPEAAGRFWDAAISKFTHRCSLFRFFASALPAAPHGLPDPSRQRSPVPCAVCCLAQGGGCGGGSDFGVDRFFANARILVKWPPNACWNVFETGNRLELSRCKLRCCRGGDAFWLSRMFKMEMGLA